MTYYKGIIEQNSYINDSYVEAGSEKDGRFSSEFDSLKQMKNKLDNGYRDSLIEDDNLKKILDEIFLR